VVARDVLRHSQQARYAPGGALLAYAAQSAHIRPEILDRPAAAYAWATRHSGLPSLDRDRLADAM
jgi:hypothetical protein